MTQQNPLSAVAGPVGISNLPNQRHRIASKSGAYFTLLLVGETGLGKTTFTNTLFCTSLLNRQDYSKRYEAIAGKSVEIKSVKAELEEKGFRVRLTVLEAQGFGDFVNNEKGWKAITDFVDTQHEAYMKKESRCTREDIVDNRIHACLYFIPPTGHSLRQIDIDTMRELGTRVNLIPVIAKADTLSPSDLATFKNSIRNALISNKISVYDSLFEDDEPEIKKANDLILSTMPFALVGSEEEHLVNGQKVRGRKYPWGLVEVENEAHSDFKLLRNLLIRSHMLDLITHTEEVLYENFRNVRLEAGGVLDDDDKARKLFEQKMKDEENALRQRFTEQVRTEESRFRQWEDKLVRQREKLMKDLEVANKDLNTLKEEVDQLTKPTTKK